MNEPAKKDQEVTDAESEVGMETESEIEVSKNTDNVGEISVEINVEDLISELEADLNIVPDAKGASCRKRLEDILEKKRGAHDLNEIDDLELTD